MELHSDWRLPTKEELKSLYDQIGDDFKPTLITNTENYFIAFFDILGFESRLRSFGLQKMIEKYQLLTNIIDKNNAKQEELKSGKFHGAFWTAEGSAMISYEIKGAYASDSILIWANRQLDGKFLPPDNFLAVCNELICASIEINLPLRGAISMGELCIDEQKGVYLGDALVDIARMEKRQNFIGATPCKAFQEQSIQAQYFLPYKSHLKELKQKELDLSFGAVLDWPRHWRNTRNADVLQIVASLSEDGESNENVNIKYENTKKLIQFSGSNSEYWKVPRDELIYG